MASFQVQTTKEWPSVLGVDVSDQNVKYMHLQRKRGKFHISAFGRYSISQTEGEEYAEESIQMVINRLFQKRKSLKKAKIVVGIEGTQVIVKNQSMPRLSKKEMKQSIGFELQREMEKDGEGIGAMISDYKVFGPDPEKSENDELMVMGVSEEIAESNILPFTLQNVVPAKLLPQVAATTNLIQFLPESMLDESIGLLDIGAKKSVLLFISRGKLDFYREIMVGGDDFTRSITGTVFHEGKAIQFNLEEATEFKLKYGYPLGFSEGMTFKGAPLTEIGAMMRPVVERLSSEIHRSIGFYADQSDRAKVETLYLIGGGARLKHLSDVLAKKLSISVNPFPVPKSITVAGNQSQKKAFASNFLQQAGTFALALEKSAAGNLLPDSYKKIHQMAGIQKIVLGIAAAIILFFVVWSMDKQVTGAKQNERLSRLEKSVNRYRQTGQLFATLSTQKSAIVGHIGSFSKFVDQDPKPIQIMRLVSQSVPKPLTLTKLAFISAAATDVQPTKPSKKPSRTAKNQPAAPAPPKPTWLLKLNGMSKVKKPELGVYVAQLMVDLEKSDFFLSVNLVYEEYTEEDDLYFFELNANVK